MTLKEISQRIKQIRNELEITDDYTIKTLLWEERKKLVKQIVIPAGKYTAKITNVIYAHNPITNSIQLHWYFEIIDGPYDAFPAIGFLEYQNISEVLAWLSAFKLPLNEVIHKSNPIQGEITCQTLVNQVCQIVINNKYVKTINNVNSFKVNYAN